MKKWFVMILTVGLSLAGVAIAQEKSSTALTYDLSASVGNYDSQSYTEINLGLNWYLQQWLIWRNAVFTRFGSNIDSITGLDTSARFAHSVRSSSGGLGIDAFAGPGLRFASSNSNALFGEAGLGFKLGGLYIGAGVKSLYYASERTDSAGRKLPRNDQQIFIILSGGGVL